MDKAQSFAMQYGYYDKGKKHACCVGYNAGYEQAEKDTIEKAWEWMTNAKGEHTFEDFRKAMEE